MIFAFLLCAQAGSAVAKLRKLCHILSFYFKKTSCDFLNWLHAAGKGHSGEWALGPSTVWMLTDHKQFGIRDTGQDFAQYLIQQSLDLKVFPKHGDEDCLCGLILPVHALEEILQHSPCATPSGAGGEFRSKYRELYYSISTYYPV